MNFYKTANGLELLTDWGDDCHGEKIYNKNRQSAETAAKKLFDPGVLIFKHGKQPRNAAEFFNNMPYTSSGNYAAVWATANYQISSMATGLYLLGIAINKNGDAVAVWGKEVFEVIR